MQPSCDEQIRRPTLDHIDDATTKIEARGHHSEVRLWWRREDMRGRRVGRTSHSNQT